MSRYHTALAFALKGACTAGLELNEDVDFVDGQRWIETVMVHVEHLDNQVRRYA